MGKTLSKGFKLTVIISIIMILITGTLRGFVYHDASPNVLYRGFIYIIQSTIFIGIVAFWANSVLLRVMHKQIKRYLISFAICCVLWLLVRDFKWYAFVTLPFLGRFSWYVFYIFMVLIPIFGLFVALLLGKDENYKLDKRWYLLFIPAVILVLVVLTNDLHQQVFSFHPNFYDWNNGYFYEWFYFVIAFFIIGILFATTYTLFNKWRHRNEKWYLPLIVLGSFVLYTISYIFMRSFVALFFDLTSTTCLLYILFWECFIQMGIIPSNTDYKELIKNSKLSAQITDKQGNPIIISKGTKRISREKFNELKNHGTLTLNQDEVLQIKQTHNGFVIWGKDISKINSGNKALSDINDELIRDIKFLQEEQKLKAQITKSKQIEKIQNLIASSMNPSITAMKQEIDKGAQKGVIDQSLKRVNVISCYVKRKSNLLLQIEQGTGITNDDMANCYRESFKGLNLLGTTAYINYNPPASINQFIHLFCYDLFQEIIEQLKFNVDCVLITLLQDEKNLRFSVSLSTKETFDESYFHNYKRDKLMDGEIQILKEEDLQVLLLLPIDDTINNKDYWGNSKAQDSIYKEEL